MVEIKIKKLYEDTKVPTCGSTMAAGHDLYARLGNEDEIVVLPHRTAMIGTGIAVAIPDGYWGGVFARSGLASKFGLRPANAVGVIDPDYRGEIIVALHNDTTIPQAVSNGDRIAQLVVCPYLPYIEKVVEELDETERGDGGFGHTGK